jgi:hypothetical protein
MSLRTFVVFKTDFSDDGTFSEKGDLVRGPGFNIATQLVEMFKQKGFEVSQVCERDYYGWTFTVSGIVSFVIQGGEPWLLIGENKGALVQKLFNHEKLESIHRDVLRTVNDFLRQDKRVHDVLWFTREDYEKGKERGPGHPEP